MPPILALFLTVGFIVFLFRRDLRTESTVSRAIWLPMIWMFLIGSRFTSEWLDMLGIHLGKVSLEDGSPLDSLVFLGLIIGGLRVLALRETRLSHIIANNRFLALFFIYGFVSILWSDFPFVALKRWIKVLGHPIMALVLVTEADPEAAVRTLMRRAAYVLIPVSVLFLKYYPEYSRGFDAWTGAPVNTGITTDKNALGYDCMIAGLFFVWNLLRVWRTEEGKTRRDEVILSLGFLGMIWWLFGLAASSTSLVSFLVGSAAIIVLGQKWVNKKYIGIYLLSGILIAGTAESVFNISDNVIAMLGKDPTLTDRTKVWADVLRIDKDPLLGAGFESFWLGDRLKQIWSIYWWHPNQAHNGYIETYLNLGLVGLCLLGALLFATFRKGTREIVTNFEYGRYRLGVLAAILIYNWTEAAFKALHLVLFVFYIISLDYPKAEPEVIESEAQDEQTEPEESLVSNEAPT
jgi:O-antigen ligase